MMSPTSFEEFPAASPLAHDFVSDLRLGPVALCVSSP